MVYTYTINIFINENKPVRLTLHNSIFVLKENNNNVEEIIARWLEQQISKKQHLKLI